MDNVITKSTYVDTKFSLDNLKRQKESILNNPTTFTGCDRLGSGKDLLLKEYYDTPDFFLHERGITINVNTLKGSKTSELVIRWCGQEERIAFLSDMPDTFVIQIPARDSIYNHAEFICNSISELVPSGLNVDLFELLKSVRKVFSIRKTREFYRFIHISGLKFTFYFTKAEYYTDLNRNKEKTIMLEVMSDTLKKNTEYNALIKKIVFNNPTLIKLQNSDILLAKQYLFK